MKANLPNFLIVGGQRCGTTYLWGLLSQHPEIFLSKKKEPQFFGELLRNEKLSLQDYAKHFDNVQNEIAIGEATVENMYIEGIAPLIFKTLGNIKLIFLLRNPILRAYSHYWMMVATHREYFSFENAIKAEKYRVEQSFYGYRNYSYLKRGLYIEQIQRFLPFFPLENMLIIGSKDLYLNTDTTLNTIYQFLGVTQPCTLVKNVDTYHVPVPTHITFFRRLNFLRLVMYGKPGYWKVAPLIRRLQNGLLAEGVAYPEMSERTREKLRHYYEEANRELSKFLGKDLNHWV